MSDTFYADTLRRLIGAGRLHQDMSILVVCGTHVDRDVFFNAGFRNVTISNIQQAPDDAGLAPYSTICQDVEALSVEDEAYDWLVVHHGLHHCRTPHHALTGMYRAARCGIIVFEPCHNALVRIGRWLKVGQEYEVHAVAANALAAGGVNNEAIPNYVYRFTVDELVATIRAYAPEFEITAQVAYHLEIHWQDLHAKQDRRPLWLARLAYPFLRLLMWIRPSWANTMCVVIPKSKTLHPWLQQDEAGHVVPNEAWFQEFGRVE